MTLTFVFRQSERSFDLDFCQCKGCHTTFTFVFRQSESSSDLDFRQCEGCHMTFTQGHDIGLPSPMSRLSYDIHSKS